jgi:hypothetical protein
MRNAGEIVAIIIGYFEQTIKEVNEIEEKF